MTSSRNVEEVALFLKKQLQKTQEADFDKAAEYRQLLIQSIHVTAIKFSEIAASVVHALMEFLGDASSSSALHVVAFVRCVSDFTTYSLEFCLFTKNSTVERLSKNFLTFAPRYVKSSFVPSPI